MFGWKADVTVLPQVAKLVGDTVHNSHSVLAVALPSLVVEVVHLSSKDVS